MKVRFIAALADSSGYSEASRNYLHALDTLKEIDLCAISPKFEMWKTDIGSYEPLVQKYTSKAFEPDVQIIHLTPDCYKKYINPKYKNIGYMAWETSKLPDKWVPQINALDEVWVPSKYNVEVLKNSGITIPVYAIPHAVNVDELLARSNGIKEEFSIPPGKFVFYSIFQWTERKNPIGLLKAFFSEFGAADNVALVIKSYVKGHAAAERDFIRSEIQRVRSSMYLTNTAPVVFIGADLSSDQMAQLHKQGNCLVFPTRCEGFSLTAFEAMAFGKPVITTGYSGHLDFCNETNSYLTNYSLTPCCNMPWPIYTGQMSWAEPDLAHLKKQMRWVYEHQEEASEKGMRAAQDVRKYSWEAVGQLMWERMKAVAGGSK